MNIISYFCFAYFLSSEERILVRNFKKWDKRRFDFIDIAEASYIANKTVNRSEASCNG